MRRFLGALLGVAALLALPVAAHAADGTTIESSVAVRVTLTSRPGASAHDGTSESANNRQIAHRPGQTASG